MTIRTRLTMWYSLAFLSVLLIILGIFAFEFYHQLSEEAQHVLQMEENWLTTIFHHEYLPLLASENVGYDTLARDLSEELEERFNHNRQFGLLVLNRPNAHVFSGGFTNIGEPVPKEILALEPGNYNVEMGAHRYAMRVFHREWGRAAVGVENEIIYKVAAEAGKILIWVAPLSLLLAAGGGWLLAKLALRPVALAAHAAESISLANLKERLPAYSGNDEFGALVGTLNRMIARLEEGVKRLQQFTEDAAHELRTPLTILRGDLEFMYQEKHVSEEVQALLQKSLDRVIEFSRIVDNLMLLAHSDSGKYPVNKSIFPLHIAVREIYEDLQILAEGKTVEVELRACETVDLFGDELLIRRLLMNLCDNALKYTRRGKVILSLTQTTTSAQFMVSDSGVGIPAEDLPFIFNRFYRVDKSRSSKTGGSGLGLAICKWIVSAHQGEINLSSTVGLGTVVRVDLPLQWPAEIKSKVPGKLSPYLASL
jgi:heavy metal sensor kinase